MKPTQHQIKPGHYRVELNERSLDIVEVAGRWYVNQFPEPPVDCGTSQSAAAYRAVEMLEIETSVEMAA